MDNASLYYLQMFGGALKLAIHTRIEPLEGGYAQASNKDFQLERLTKVKSDLTFKINSGTLESISGDILDTYKLYLMQ
ncbi:hypothetical protein [Desulfoluna sp.]|uniref:hypothetical protein n=1 Tax=Desulfoluna sp. TaxID=2045199 RepID=UPI0026266E44|nr:hypothetical protein [Desulfoluna sp.]